jgi:hypothetical protein
MDTYYRIRVKGHLDSHRSAWFDNMIICNQANGEALLCGPLPDQAALHGMLIKIRDLGLPLLAVTTVAADKTQYDEQLTPHRNLTRQKGNHDEQPQQEANDNQ